MNDADEYQHPPDPNALTQPIPVVAAPLPVRPLPAGAPTVVRTAATAAYVHRFGSIPLYLLARFAAFCVDLFGVAFVIATFAFQLFDAGFIGLVGRNEGGFDALAGGSLGGALLFAFLCEGLFGTTLGKLLFGLHVRRAGGGRAGFMRALVRSLTRPIDILLIGPLLALVTPRHQRAGDLVCGTVVSRSKLGPFAPVIGMVSIVVIGYAQVVAGGGISSAIGVFAETASFAPALYARAAHALGIHTSISPQGVSQPTPAAPSPRAEPSRTPIMQ